LLEGELDRRELLQLDHNLGHRVGLRCAEIDGEGSAFRDVALHGDGNETVRGVANVNVVALWPHVAEAQGLPAGFELSDDLRQQVRVCLTRPNHVEEPHDDSRKAALGREVVHEVLAVQLAVAVDVAGLQRRSGLFVRLLIGLIDRTAAGEHEPRSVGCRQEQVDRAVDVRAHRQRGIHLALGYVVDGGEVNDRIGSEIRHQLAGRGRIGDVHLLEAEVLQFVTAEPHGTAAQIVGNAYGVLVVEEPSHFAADETVAACYENFLAHVPQLRCVAVDV
jgi:hypothetical protein